jgi:hypothetical protein
MGVPARICLVITNPNQQCRHVDCRKHKEVGTRFELANIPFAEDSLGPLGQPTLFF